METDIPHESHPMNVVLHGTPEVHDRFSLLGKGVARFTEQEQSDIALGLTAIVSFYADHLFTLISQQNVLPQDTLRNLQGALLVHTMRAISLDDRMFYEIDVSGRLIVNGVRAVRTVMAKVLAEQLKISQDDAVELVNEVQIRLMGQKDGNHQIKQIA